MEVPVRVFHQHALRVGELRLQGGIGQTVAAWKGGKMPKKQEGREVLDGRLVGPNMRVSYR